jgi:Ca-activated chloride channel family protein
MRGQSLTRRSEGGTPFRSAGRARAVLGLAILAALVFPQGAAVASPVVPSPDPSAPVSAGATSVAPPADPDAQASLELVLDTSGSMAESDPSGTTKLAGAQAALHRMILGLPGNAKVGLRTYGGAASAPSCQSTNLLVPVAALDRDRLGTAVDGVRAAGPTPIGLSLQRAASDLKGTGPKTIVLVSDGLSTCPPDPCPTARQLASADPDLRIDTVGFAVDAAARAQLSCIARETHGSYYDAKDASALAAQLSRASVRAFRAYTSRSQPVAGTPTSTGAPGLATGEWVDSLTPGQTSYYTVTFPTGSTPSVTATLVRPAGRFGENVRDGLSVGLETTDGVDCGEESGSGYQTRQVTPLTVTAAPGEVGGPAWLSPFNYPVDKGCGRAGKYALRVERDAIGADSAEALPVELTVLIEPAAKVTGLPGPTTTSLPPTGAASPSVPPVPPVPDFTTQPKRAPGGTGYTDAGEVGTGVTSDTIRAGETLFWRVKVGWGQQLSYAVRFERTRDSSTSTKTWVANPQRVDIDALDPGPDLSYYDGDATSDLTVLRDHTVPVNYRNRENVKDEAAAPTSVAGWYYVAVQLSDDPDLVGVDVPLQLAVRVDGQRSGIPDYRYVAGAATAKQLFAESTPANAADSTPLVTGALLVLGVFALLAAVAVIATPLLRSRHR